MFSRRKGSLFTTLAGAACFASAWMAVSAASAAPIVNLGVSPTTISNTSGQVVNVTVSSSTSGTDNFHAAEIFIQVGDGGVDNTPPGTSVGGVNVPKITGIDMTQGIFLGNNIGESGKLISPDKLLGFDSITATTGTSVNDNGTLASITFDATGLAPGTFTFRLFNVGANDASFANGSSDWNDTTPTTFSFSGTPASNAVTITVVPEPASCALLLGAGACLLMRRRKRPLHAA
jgi:hypothetical protein